GDYEFLPDETGTVMVRAIAADNFGSVIVDSLSFDIMSIQKSAGFKFVDSRIIMEIDAESVNKNEKIIIIPEENDRIDRYYDVERITENRLSRPIISYYIGPEYSSFTKGTIKFKINDFTEDRSMLDKLGIYFYDNNNGLLRFISNEIAYNEQLIKADINKFGRYVVAADMISPKILSAEKDRQAGLTYILDIIERGSGIRNVITRVDEERYNSNLTLTDDDKFAVEITNFKYEGQKEIFFTAIDNAGNMSGDYRLEIDRDSIPLPDRYELKDNYPNPFNPTTTIEYQIPEADIVILEIYNIKGQLVRTLVNKTQSAGLYRIKWDGMDSNRRRVASGVYIYSIRTKNYKKAKKMVLLK
ncbi:MAG: T9SS type A sorting domain-containing protein, partial [bacterium]|nr:T9SS type A sorting domain-containing protein [bacterium]